MRASKVARLGAREVLVERAARGGKVAEQIGAVCVTRGERGLLLEVLKLARGVLHGTDHLVPQQILLCLR